MFRFLIRSFLVLLVAAFGAVSAVASPGDWTRISNAVEVQYPSLQPVNLTNSSRAPPLTSANVMAAGAAPAQTGSLRALDGVETTEATYAVFQSSIAPNRGLPSGYTRNADGTIIGPGGGIARDTGHVDASGNIVLRRDSGGYYTVDANGNQASVPSPYTDGAPPVHHVCTNKNCTSTANGGPWTPRFEEYFDNAGLNINSEINKIAVPGHRGPHPAEYHQYVYSQLDEATQGLTPNTPAYTNAVSNTLNDIKVEAVTPGNQVNDWLTGN